jgi:hypothetical protein
MSKMRAAIHLAHPSHTRWPVEDSSNSGVDGVALAHQA